MALQVYPAITVLDLDPKNQPRLRATEIRLYDMATTDPTSPTPSDGDLYYNTALNEWMFYDGFRSKWLSISKVEAEAGRSANTNAGQWFRGTGNTTFSTTIGVPVPKSTLVALSLYRTNATTATLDVYNNGSSVVTLATTASGLTANNSINVDITAGAVSFLNQAGGNTMTDVLIKAVFRRRV